MSGVSATLQVLLLLFKGHYNVNFTVLSTFIGIGLLMLKPTWRIVALVYTWFYIVQGIVSAFDCLIFPSHNQIWGPTVSQLPPFVGSIMGLMLFGIGIWQLKVLNSKQVRLLFNPTT